MLHAISNHQESNSHTNNEWRANCLKDGRVRTLKDDRVADSALTSITAYLSTTNRLNGPTVAMAKQ